MLESVFIGTTIFAGVVVLADFIGMAFSSHGDDEGGEAGDSGDHDDHGGDDHDTDLEGDHESRAGHDKQEKSLLLSALSVLRTFLYFCLGFGPAGWYALSTGETSQAALFWALGLGIFIATIARLVRRLQRNELDSQVRDTDLLFKKATILVSIKPGQLGRVRIEGRQVNDRFARAKDKNREYKAGSRVKVVDFDGENLVIE